MPLGHDAATARLIAARGSIYAAFDNLACGMGHDEAVAYLSGSPHFTSLPEDVRGKVAGLCMGFALTAVESDRRVNRSPRGEDHKGRVCPVCGPLGEWNACPHDVQGEGQEAE